MSDKIKRNFRQNKNEEKLTIFTFYTDISNGRTIFIRVVGFFPTFFLLI